MVVAASEHLHVIQEEDSSKRRQILDGARTVSYTHLTLPTILRV